MGSLLVRAEALSLVVITVEPSLCAGDCPDNVYCFQRNVYICDPSRTLLRSNTTVMHRDDTGAKCCFRSSRLTR